MSSHRDHPIPELENMEVSLSKEAAAKVICHACKHPSRAVSGILLGSINGNAIVVSDAVPLFHEHGNLAPMTEVGLRMVRRKNDSVAHPSRSNRSARPKV